MTTFVFDFDSTLVDFETLDELAILSAADVDAVSRITDLAMEGKMDFRTALQERVKLLNANGDHIAGLADQVVNRLTPSVKRNAEWFRENDVYVVSGGFSEIIHMATDFLGIPREKVFANHFIWFNGRVIDAGGPVSYEFAKSDVVKSIKKSPIVMIGDGWSDWQVREANCVDCFYGFSEIVRREAVVRVCDHEAKSLEDIISLVG